MKMLQLDLDTPALVIDLDIMERNLARVAGYCAEHNLRLRPHTKTHKSPALARRQLALGAVGLTVAKVSEAEIMAPVLSKTDNLDLLIAYPVVGEPKLRRLIEVARITPVIVALDSMEAAIPLSEAAVNGRVDISILIEVDVGLGRVGVSPAEAVSLARAVSALPNLHFRGLTFYPGHIKHPDEASIRSLSDSVAGLVQDFRRAGLVPEIVSGGSTPALFHSHSVEGITEIRPGTYIFNDLNTIYSGACTLEECAASVLVTVVSHARQGHMIIDGGSKTFSSDRLSSGGPGHGRINEAPGALFHKMNEEHGFVDLAKAEREFQVGDKVQIIPNHICVAVNLHEQIYGVRNGMVEEVWKVEGRGKLQ